MEHEVIIAATSVVCAAGPDLSECLSSMASGAVNARIEYPDQLPKRTGGIPVYRVDPNELNTDFPRRVARMDRTTLLAAAAVSALRPTFDLTAHGLQDSSGGIFHGSSRGPVEKQVQSIEGWQSGRQRPGFAVDVPFGSTAGFLAGMLDSNGPALTISATCCSGAHALIEAAWAVRSGRMDWALVAAADAAVHPSVLGQMQVAGMLTTETTRPDRGCLPFHHSRTGTTLGEGAAAVLLCSPDQISKIPGTSSLGRLCGWDASNDCHSRTMSDPNGFSLEKSIRSSLTMAGLTPANLERISPHGTGTIYNDKVELNALRRLYPDSARAAPQIIPTKHFTGHCLGATSLIEICFMLEFLRGTPLPDMNYLDQPIAEERFLGPASNALPVGKSPERYGLSQSLGFWGNINSVVLAVPEQ